MTKHIRIAIAGPRGNMGTEAVKLTDRTEHFELCAVIDSKNNGSRLKDIAGMPAVDVPVYTDINQCFQENTIDVLIDLTNPETGRKHLEASLAHGVSPVVGTTGFTEADIEKLSREAEQKQIGVVIAPNFAIGAVLMMKFAKMAAAYMPDVEIMEMHHDRKLDAPSGTAIKTAELIKENRASRRQGHENETESLAGARGADIDGMKIHSVRLPGLVAHQQVMFGGAGQTLTIKHDSINRESFMPGVQLAVEHVVEHKELVYGLENIM
ncbi:dihydrodipicolinate reductase [Sinobaca qinghaiensis]|uniref:4-hydroxy-tetrahydrodipicolinate reductase n=1 Tax=Sinobaca qinghaiensis TaxID=342944 RepID=A0A419V2T0_9BACL|nr:4-hydroxy-tetrahydrodipicolinate reductase [Sinobaca qinghaiensis]RKD72833.1 dihydrodipicolinate reductase [Sinobaca qinghaiensis]